MKSVYNKILFSVWLALPLSLGLPAVKARAAAPLRAEVMVPGGAVRSNAPVSPLGSLWKLYIYAYLTEQNIAEGHYKCSGENPEEIFCCKPGEVIGRDLALARSCTPYFEAARSNVEKKVWQAFWNKKVQDPPAWLVELSQLKPQSRVNVDEILYSLLEIKKKFAASDRIVAATLGTVLHGTATQALNIWGTTLRVKTFTWRDAVTIDEQNADELGFVGGFAGWLPDGAAIWVSAAGHGREAFRAELKNLVTEHMQKYDGDCVVVKYFDRYPIETVSPRVTHLKGPVRIKFKNSKVLNFDGDGSLQMDLSSKIPAITARLSLNEYVARVLDREVQTQPLEAARAFAVAIRTYLLQNSQELGGCRVIGDSSHTQRVSPRKASAAALAIARWSDGLVLDRVHRLRYHSTRSAADRLAWTQAKNLAESGFNMKEILKVGYPTGILAFEKLNQPLQCRTNPLTEKWVNRQSALWQRRLNQVPGFERPENLKICESQSARVFSHPVKQEIYVPLLQNYEDEVSILHEYLHIAFRFHPRGKDERFVESMAIKLLEEK